MSLKAHLDCGEALHPVLRADALVYVTVHRTQVHFALS